MHRGGCVILNQLGAAQPVAPDPAIIIGTLTIPVINPGYLQISVGSATWFGAPAPPPVTVPLGVPEPGGASLLALGLLGLALRPRRRN